MEDVNIENLRLVRTDLVRRQTVIASELETIRADIEAVDRMLGRYGGQTTLDVLNTPSPTGVGEFANSSLRESVLAVMRRNLPSDVRVSRIRQEIVDGGYASKSNDLRPAIFAMISKLLASGQVRKIDKGLFRYVEREHSYNEKKT